MLVPATVRQQLVPGTEYLAACRDLAAARAAYFAELRRLFSDVQAGRQIRDLHWVANPALGTLIVADEPEAGRSFRLVVLHLGEQLRLCVRLPAWHNAPESAVVAKLIETFCDRAPERGESEDDEVLLTWTFSATELLSGPQGMAGPTHRVVAVFSTAVQALVPTKKET